MLDATQKADRELTQCDTCGAFGPDVVLVGRRAGVISPSRPERVYLCRPCRQAQGFDPPADPRPSVLK